MNFDVSIIEKYGPLILSGLPMVLFISAVSAVFGFLIGLLAVFLRGRNKVLKTIVNGYIDLIRGTPVYVQLIFFYLGLPGLFPGFNPPEVLSCIIVFSINSGAYLSEILRAGVEGIDRGQIEAAKALGVSKSDIARHIIFPLALRNVLPAVMNEFITLTKETSIVSVIGVADMMYRYNNVSASTYSTFEPLLVIFIAYYILNVILSQIGRFIERKLSYA
ncbi:amino acid ABC transporter permease [Erysipelotrichaceae bacterium MTC7]|nr:amino acid ABC transporter permease [Erysipelotrichaceae bacterium MTC7]